MESVLVTQGLWLIPLGVVVGALGTLIGAGGGFVLMPVLLLLYPDENRVHANWIIRGLAAALAIVGVRILVTAF